MQDGVNLHLEKIFATGIKGVATVYRSLKEAGHRNASSLLWLVSLCTEVPDRFAFNFQTNRANFKTTARTSLALHFYPPWRDGGFCLPAYGGAKGLRAVACD
jgi:hypothetical protein